MKIWLRVRGCVDRPNFSPFRFRWHHGLATIFALGLIFYAQPVFAWDSFHSMWTENASSSYCGFTNYPCQGEMVTPTVEFGEPVSAILVRLVNNPTSNLSEVGLDWSDSLLDLCASWDVTALPTLREMWFQNVSSTQEGTFDPVTANGVAYNSVSEMYNFELANHGIFRTYRGTLSSYGGSFTYAPDFTALSVVCMNSAGYSTPGITMYRSHNFTNVATPSWEYSSVADAYVDSLISATSSADVNYGLLTPLIQQIQLIPYRWPGGYITLAGDAFLAGYQQQSGVNTSTLQLYFLGTTTTVMTAQVMDEAGWSAHRNNLRAISTVLFSGLFLLYVYQRSLAFFDEVVI